MREVSEDELMSGDIEIVDSEEEKTCLACGEQFTSGSIVVIDGVEYEACPHCGSLPQRR